METAHGTDLDGTVDPVGLRVVVLIAHALLYGGVIVLTVQLEVDADVRFGVRHDLQDVFLLGLGGLLRQVLQ